MKNKSAIIARLLVVFSFTLMHMPVNAQSFHWLWSRNDGGTGAADQASFVTEDSKGNVLVTGYFSGPTITFGSVTLANVVSGNYDIFLVKYDPLGNVLWAKSAGGSLSDYGLSVTTDAADNIYVSGNFESPTITFGGITLTNTISPNGDSFLAEYDQNGNAIMAKNDVSSVGANSINSIAVVPGMVYGAGSFQGSTLTFGSVVLTNANTPNQSPYLIKFKKSGTALWAVNPTGNSADAIATSVSPDTLGNVFITGYFTSPTITFGSITLNNLGLGIKNVFVVRYDSNGNVKWARSGGGSERDLYASGVSADRLGNVYVSGYFKSSTATFGPFVLTNRGFGSVYSTAFLVKYDVNGNVVWANTTGGAPVSNGMSSVWADSKAVYGVGEFQGPNIKFGLATLNNPNSLNEMPYLVKYDPNGNGLWATNPVGNTQLFNAAVTVASNKKGDLSIAGFFTDPSITFGSNPSLVNVNTTEYGMFVAHVDTCTIKYAVNSATICAGQNAVLNVSGGTNYIWSTGDTVSSITVNPDTTTTYILNVSNSYCSADTMVTVTVNPAPVLSIAYTDKICVGEAENITASGGTTYSWNNGNTSPSILVSPDSTTSYTVTASNGLCLARDSITVQVFQYPVPAVSKTPYICPGTAATLSASGGTSYTWSTGAKTSSITVYPVNDKTYTVNVSNGVCSINDSIEVYVKPAPVTSVCCDSIITQGQNVQLISSGGGAYSWLPPTALSCDTCADPIATPAETTVYTVTITNDSGCAVSKIVTIEVEIPCLSFTVPNVFTPTFAGPTGVDNLFYINTSKLESWYIIIYDRWGKVMFATTNPNQYWDGKAESGGEAPAGVYYYIINTVCQSNTYKRDGYLQLIR